MKHTQTGAWWHKPLRVIQPNLQVRDTEKIDAGRLAEQLAELGANAIVFNVGGIYAWYATNVDNHTRNGFLPAQGDLLADVIDACHRRGLRFIARYDFSKAEDAVYLRHPEWFVRDGRGEPHVLGARRPGEWSLLMSTCINSAYRAEAVAVPVLAETLSRYAIDGVFLNNPGYIPCFCDGCKRKYRECYGESLPQSAELFHPEWRSRCMRDNIAQLRGYMREQHPEVPLILYYNLYRDNLYDRAATADMLCTEPQDVLSLGHRHIPEFWKPALAVKLGGTLPARPRPFGIVHSSPGMDWRHTGLPPAEYRFWLCQIPANGGHIWHSLTGVPDTITDKRILDVVREHNHMARRIEPYMDGAVTGSEVALIWNAAPSAEGWADGFLERQIPFDVLLPVQAENGALSMYRVVVCPDGLEWTPALLAAVRQYAEAGGSVIVEGVPGEGAAEHVGVCDLIGAGADTFTGEELTASYLRFEQPGAGLQHGMEHTELIAHRGRVAYCRPHADTATWATLVPPFSPLESVGAPPERASLAVERTSIPLVLHRALGAGRIMGLPFALGALLREFRLDEHYTLLANMVRALTDGKLKVRVSHSPGLQASVFQRGGELLVQLVNGAGRRPLTGNIPLHNIRITVRYDGEQPPQALAVISGEQLAVARVEPGIAEITLPVLPLWEAVRIYGGC